MAVVKGKLNSLSDQITKYDHHAAKPKLTMTAAPLGLPSFQIFAEPRKFKIHARHSLISLSKTKSSLNGRRCEGSASTSKNGVKSLEKNKGKHDNSVKANIGRKVLGDISNFRGSFSRTKAQDRPKSLCTSRNSVVGAESGSCSSRKPFTGNVRTEITQVADNHHIVKKVTNKDMKATSNELRTNPQGGKLVNTTNVRTYGGNPLPPTRKSFPVVKEVNKVTMSNRKQDSTEISKRRRGFPVNSKVGRNVASRVYNSQSHLWKGRVSDGYTMMTSEGQCNTDVGAGSRRSAKPMPKMMTTASKMQRPLNSKGVSVFNKSAAGSSKKEEEKAKFSSTKHIAAIVPKEQPAQEEVSAFSKSNSDKTTADNVARRKFGRRKSFTSSLMSRSKEEIPNIYDDHNPLEVTEYVDDIYQYYWVMEAHNQPLKYYMEIQTEITPQMRGILINWLIEVHLKFDLMQETLFLMVTLLDQFLSLESIKKNKMQLVGLTALLLASKYEDFWHPRIMDLIGISADSYTRDEMLGMETTFLKTLMFRLNAPTPYVFMLRFLKASQSDKKFEHLAFYLIELCLVEYETLKHKPSLLSASAIYLARCTMQMTPTWTPLLEKHSRYEESQIRHCAGMILKFHKTAKTAMLKVTYEKYMGLDFSSVAAITPLEMLPQ